jgi:ABC-2 type transport system permease protein
MNYQVVKRLVWKDWYLCRQAILMAIGAGFVCTGIVLFGGKGGFILGLIALITILIGGGAYLAMQTTVMERKEKTLPFVMSLPFSYREFTAAKILANLLAFLVLWFTLVFLSFFAVAMVPELHGLVSYVAVMSVEILVSTSLVIAVAIMTESQGWTIAAIIFGNLALNGFGYYVAHIDSIGRAMWKAHFYWSPAATTILLAEFVTVALLLGATLFVQSRKTDFI